MAQNEETRSIAEEDEEEIPWLEEDDLRIVEAYAGFSVEQEDIDIEAGRKTFVEHYCAQIHGVDVGLQENVPMVREALQGLVEAIGSTLGDPDAVINPFFNQRDRQGHLLIVSKRPLLDVIRALPADAAYSAVPAFLTDEEHLAANVYLYMTLNRCYATTLSTY